LQSKVLAFCEATVPKKSNITEIKAMRHDARKHMDSRSHAEYIVGTSLQGMIREGLVAERIAIHSYRETIQGIGDKDPTTSDLLKRILAVEEEHADELVSLLDGMPQD
jgi:bacterioferritin